MKAVAPLPRSFFEPSARLVAPALLGHWLIRRTPDGPMGGFIVETEAYLIGDPACHAARGLTARNRVMFGPPGYAYVYFIYGCHFCVNTVCLPAGVAEAVLIRAIEPRIGIELMQRYRRVRNPGSLTNGPGKVCAALDITRGLDGADLCGQRSPLYVGRNDDVAGFRLEKGPLNTSTRIGITQAAELPLRFYLVGSSSVSRPVRLGANAARALESTPQSGAPC